MDEICYNIQTFTDKLSDEKEIQKVKKILEGSVAQDKYNEKESEQQLIKLLEPYVKSNLRDVIDISENIKLNLSEQKKFHDQLSKQNWKLEILSKKSGIQVYSTSLQVI